MKMNNFTRFYQTILLSLLIIPLMALYQCRSGKATSQEVPQETLNTNQEENGTPLQLTFLKGPEHNYPLMAVWLETTDGKYIETLYIANSIGEGVFRHAEKSEGKWKPGPIRRPAALPYWSHQRGVKASDGLYTPDEKNPMPDAVTGATPTGSFWLNTRTSEKLEEPFNILFEINQSWDWNEYWTNNKFPEDEDYKTSSQPALVYSATIDPSQPGRIYVLKPVGHSHYSGKDGSLNEDLSTMTTALEIADKITVTIGGGND
jgi:hypothetical protein